MSDQVIYEHKAHGLHVVIIRRGVNGLSDDGCECVIVQEPDEAGEGAWHLDVTRAGEGAWHLDVTRVLRLQLPDNLDGLIHARLAAMAPDDRELLARAASVGREFWTGALLALARSTADETDHAPAPADHGGDAALAEVTLASIQL